MSTSTSHTTTTTWTTSRNTLADASTSRSTTTTTTYTTTWITLRVTSHSTTTSWTTSVPTFRSTTTSWSTFRQTSQSTDTCVVEGTEIHISTTQTKPVEQLYSHHDILSLDCAFNINDQTQLLSVTSETIDGEKVIHSISSLMGMNAIGVWIINNGLLKTTDSHMHVIKRDGLWQIKKSYELQLGDIYVNINNEEIEITSLVLDDVNIYKVFKIDVEPNDVYYANGILTHNKDEKKG